jgi:phosphohistidine phosphatase
MQRLILFRHGQAEHESGSGEDFDRRLTPRGARESAAMGETLAEFGLVPDLVLVSTSARTRDTWTAAQPAFPKAEARFEEALYHAEAGAVRRLAQAVGPAVRTVMVVGHNPGLQELAVQMLLEGRADAGLISTARRQFPTAAAAVFLIDAKGRPAYDGFFLPRGGEGH